MVDPIGSLLPWKRVDMRFDNVDRTRTNGSTLVINTIIGLPNV